MRIPLLVCFFFLSFFCSAQNVGVGTTTPQSRLHVKGTGGGTQIILEENAGSVLRISNEANAAGAYIGTSSNHGFSIVSNNAVRMVVAANGNVGIGTSSPQQILSVATGITLDQNNTNTGTIVSSLRFGNNSFEAIGSKRTSGTGQFGLDFYTNSLQRMTIAQNGNIGINNGLPKSKLTIYHAGSLQIPLDIDDGHAITIFDSSNFSNFEPRLSLNIGISSSWEYAYIRVRKSTTAGPVPRLLLNPLAEGAVVVGGGGDGSGYSQEASNYKFIVGSQSPSLFDTKVDITTNLTVQNGKGIIRGIDGIQQKKQVRIVSVVDNLNAGQTKSFGFSWLETFGGAPDAFVGGIASGSSGGWAEVVMTVAADNTTGGTLWVHNPRNTSVILSYNVKIIGIGPQ